jgi:hypothetical protein
MNSFVKSLLNIIPHGPSTPSCLLNTISRNVEDKVLILNTDGSRIREIRTDGGFNNNLLYSERNDQLLLRQSYRGLVVLINCMEFSPGRVTTALSVHGTTVIHQGRLVNDISSS